MFKVICFVKLLIILNFLLTNRNLLHAQVASIIGKTKINSTVEFVVMSSSHSNIEKEKSLLCLKRCDVLEAFEV